MKELFLPLHDRDHVDRSGYSATIEESFLEVPDGTITPNRPLGLFADRSRGRLLFLVIIATLLIFIGRVAFLQLHEGEAYAAIAEQNRLRVQVVRASRGLILDTRGRDIVENIPEFIVTVVPAELPKSSSDYQAVLEALAAHLGEAPLALAESIALLPAHPLAREQRYPFRDHLPRSTALALLVNETTLPGFHVEVRERRVIRDQYVAEAAAYDMPSSIAHLVGYLGNIDPESIDELLARGYTRSDLVGKNGVERFYDARLHGTHGRVLTETNAFGRATNIVNEDIPVSGAPLTLTIDLELQRILERRLDEAVRALPDRERQGAVGIAIDPRDGSIRAMVSLPTYDPSLFEPGASQEAIRALFADPRQPLFPRAVAGTYPSGSVIKPFIALAALEEGIINEHTTVLSAGGIAVGGSFFPDWRAGGHGVTDVRHAIADSVNTFFYIIGGGYDGRPGLGPERIASWLNRFSFGTRLGVDVPGESAGLVPTPEWKRAVKGESWYLGNTYHLAIGQGDLLVSPLQMAAAYAALANGGTLFVPHIEEKESPDVLTHTIASKGNIDIIRSALRQTVTQGSARLLAQLPFSSAGKTGTAQWKLDRPAHAWFAGFAPYEHPELVLVILIEEGEGGAQTATPVAYDVFREYFEILKKR